MNQEKIGNFIAKERKKNGYTQEQLAEKLGVSINAVSKWERGLNLPDASLYKKLCNELNISIEELINGESDTSDIAKERAIMETIKEKDNIRKKSRKIIFSLIIMIILLIAIVLINKLLTIKYENNSEDLYELAIDYLKNEEIKNNKDSNKKDFNSFYTYHRFGIEKRNSKKYVYMWVFSQSYFIEEKDALAISYGISAPYKFTFNNKKITKVEYVDDDEYFKKMLKDVFPSQVIHQILDYKTDKNLNKMLIEVMNRKNKYYSYLNLDLNKITLNDLEYNNLLMSIEIGNKECIPVQLNIYKDKTYRLYTHYKACKPNQLCTDVLNYTKFKEGTYNFDVLEIIKHSIDANNFSYTNDNLPTYKIFSGKSHSFETDNDNKYLKELLNQLDVDLNVCAKKDYIS